MNEPPSLLTQSGQQRLNYIDGLRALAALWVVLHHVWLIQQPRLSHEPFLMSVLGLLAFGKIAVMVFLVLSGFCLYYPLVSKQHSMPVMTVSYAEYIKRRVRRILPPYYSALGIILFVIFLIPQMRVIPADAPAYCTWMYALPVNGLAIVSHILLIHNLVEYSLRIDPPMWSIGLEWQLYFLFPVLVWVLRRCKTSIVFWLVLLLTASSRFVGWELSKSPHKVIGIIGTAVINGPTSYWMVFLTGMLAALVVTHHRGSLSRPFLGGVTLSAFAGVVVLFHEGLGHDVCSSVAAFCLILLAADSSTWLHRMLSCNGLVKLGLFSYSIYLIHMPIAYLSWLVLVRIGLGPTAIFLTLVILIVPIIILCSYGFHVAFERPFMGKPRERKTLVFRRLNRVP